MKQDLIEFADWWNMNCTDATVIISQDEIDKFLSIKSAQGENSNVSDNEKSKEICNHLDKYIVADENGLYCTKCQTSIEQND